MILKNRIIIAVLAVASSFGIVNAANIIVGDYNGTFEVSPTGAATYNIPIECPKGVNRMEPSVALSYNSQSRIGMVGLGWNLSAYSLITKVNATKYYDSKNVPINADNSADYLALDGQRLIKYKTISSSQVEFRTECDNFNRIVRRGTNGNYTFEVYTPDGKTLTYRQQPEGAAYYMGNLGWFLAEVTDMHGNYMTYLYDATNSAYNTTCVKLVKIQYGGNKKTGISHSCYIEFSYTELLPFSLEYAIGGYKKSFSSLLSEIKTYSNSTLNLKYKLTYTTDALYRKTLSKVTKYGNNGDFLLDLAISWNTISEKLTEKSQSSISFKKQDNETYQNWIPFDYNDDGKLDLISYAQIGTLLQNGNSASVVQQPYIRYCKNIGTGQFSYDKTEKLNIGSLNHTFSNNVLVGHCINISRPDIVLPCLYFDSKTKTRSLRLYNMKNVADFTTVNLTTKTTEVPVCASADLNKDGYTDFVYIEKDKTSSGDYVCGILYGKESSSISKLREDAGFTFKCVGKITAINIADMNGDGLPDIIVVSDNGYTVFKNKGTLSFYDSNQNYKTGMSYNPSSDNLFVFGDFNGDGICDYYKNKYLYLGNADFTFKAVPRVLMSADTPKFAISTDIDGDGVSELAVFCNNGKQVLFYKHNDDFFNIISNSTNNNREVLKGDIVVGDFNSDGREEVVSMGKSLIGTGVANNCIFTTNLISDAKGGLVSKISSPMKDIIITYDNISNSSFYKGSSTYYATSGVLALRTSILNVVSSYTERPKKGSDRTYNYNYERALVQVNGKGFLGFQTINVKDLYTGIVTSHYNGLRTSSCVLLYPYQETRTYGSQTLSQKEDLFTFSCYGENSRCYSLLKSRTTDEDFLTGRKTVSNYSQHKNGIPCLITVDKGANVEEKIEYKEFDINNVYNVFTPKTEIVTKTNTAGSISTTKKIRYNGYLDTLEIKYNYNTPKEVTTTYAYNKNGTIKTKVISAKDCETRTLTYGYTSSGRFQTSIEDSYGETVKDTYNESYGRKTKTEVIVGTSSKITKYDSYDGFNNCIKMTYPDGRVRTINSNYDDSYQTGHYLICESVTGSPNKKSLYNSDGKVVRESKEYADGQIRHHFMSYNRQGQAEYNYELTTGTSPIGNMYNYKNSYDIFGRLTSAVSPEGTTSYTYNKKNITIITPKGTKELDYNDAGQLVKSTENGKTVSFTYNPMGLVATATAESTTKNLITTLEYDEAGNRTKLNDPDLGTVYYDYDSYGRLTSQTEKGIETYYVYDSKGRLEEEGSNDTKCVYTYNANNLLEKETGNNYYNAYEYDDYGRLTKKTVKAVDATFVTKYGYSKNYGEANTITYPSGITVTNTYNDYGYHVKTECAGKIIWAINKINTYGYLLEETLPGSVVHSYTYASNRQINTEKAYKGSLGLVDLKYNYSGANLVKKIDNLTGNTESYSYNSLNQLLSVIATNGSSTLQGTHTYDGLGNLTKTWDNYWKNISYGGSLPPHQVSSVSYTNSSITNPSVIRFDPYRMVSQIDKGAYSYRIDYNNNHQRLRSLLYKSNNLQYSTYYMGNYEKVVYPNETREIHYLQGARGLAGIYVKCGGKDTLFAAVTDRQNSLTAIMDIATNKVEKFSYKPWGMRRNSNNWSDNVLSDYSSRFSRGYCMHEHIPYMGMINMNGRIYNEQTYQFLSADPHRQDPESWLSCNRFAYCMNNPIMKTDPTGKESLDSYFINIMFNYATNLYYSNHLQYKTDYTPITVQYSDKFANDVVENIPISNPNTNVDAISIYIGGVASAGKGINASLEIGYMFNEGSFISVSYGQSYGIDLSIATGLKISNHVGNGVATINSYGGEGTQWSFGGGPVDVGVTRSADHNWESINLGWSVGSPLGYTINKSNTLVNSFSSIGNNIKNTVTGLPLEFENALNSFYFSQFY